MRDSARLTERNTTAGVSRPLEYNSTETCPVFELSLKNRKERLSGWCADLVRPLWTKFAASSVAQRLAHGTFWALSGALAARAAGLVSSIAAARFLGKTAFGEFAMIQSTAGMFTVFAGFGLGLAATKHVAELRKTDTAKLGRILAVSGLMVTLAGAITAAALFFAAGRLAVGALAAPNLAGPLRLAAVLLLLDATSSAQAGALSGFEAFRKIAGINLWVGLTSVPITIAGVWIAGLLGAIWGLIATRALNVFLSHRALQQQIRLGGISIRMASCAMELKTLLNFSLPSVISAVFIMCASWGVQRDSRKAP